MVFPVITYGCESWTIKKSEPQRIWAFKLWCWRGLLKVPWTARRSKQLILREIKPEYSLEGQMLNLKLHYFVHLWEQLTHWKNPWYWESLRAEGEEGIRGWDGWMASGIQWIWTWANSRRWWGTRKICILQSMWSCRVRYNLATEFNFFIILVYLLLIALGLHCCTWAFSSCREQELTSSSSAQASHWNGFYCYGAQALEASVSVSAACTVSN